MADPNQTKQIVTDVVGDYWKLFPLILKYYPPTSASGNISNFGKIISNSHLIIRNYLYNSHRYRQ